MEVHVLVKNVANTLPICKANFISPYGLDGNAPGQDSPAATKLLTVSVRIQPVVKLPKLTSSKQVTSLLI